MCGNKCLNPQVAAGQNTDSIVCTGVSLLAPTLLTWGRGPAAQRGLPSIFPAGTWEQGLGLCVLLLHSCLLVPRGMAETHNLCLFAVLPESHRDWKEGGPRGLYELTGLTAWWF